ncbi:hypothetical protein LINGRAHAP2_LOCUS16416 [Linum grandiflorum]
MLINFQFLVQSVASNVGENIRQPQRNLEQKKRFAKKKKKMVKVSTYFAMTLGAFVFWQSMDKLHVWIALHQDEKTSQFPLIGKECTDLVVLVFISASSGECRAEMVKNGSKRKWRSRGLENSCFDKLKKATLSVETPICPLMPISRTLSRYQDIF